jgi:putative nucleotidyltransferase with HDIG domain
MSTHLIDEIVERVGTLPPLPAMIDRLVQVVGDPKSSLAQIVETIRYDQVLTTEVLRLCNSAYFGLSRKIESLDDAVRLLGTVKVLQLVIAAHTKAMLSRPQSGYGLPAGALWLHSIGVALGTQQLARPMKLTHLGLLFTAGLLHDVGKVVLNEFVAKEYAEIAQCVAQRHCSFAEAEQEVLGFTHPEVGARLAEKWSLPQTIVRCIRYHHTPEACPEPDPLVDAVHLSDSVCILLGVGAGDDGLSYRVSQNVLDRYALSQSELEIVGADVIAEVKSVQAMLSSN